MSTSSPLAFLLLRKSSCRSRRTVQGSHCFDLLAGTQAHVHLHCLRKWQESLAYLPYAGKRDGMVHFESGTRLGNHLSVSLTSRKCSRC